MLVELKLVEQRYRAAIDVLDGMSVTDVARRNGVSRQTVHAGPAAEVADANPAA